MGYYGKSMVNHGSPVAKRWVLPAALLIQKNYVMENVFFLSNALIIVKISMKIELKCLVLDHSVLCSFELWYIFGGSRCPLGNGELVDNCA